MKMVTLMAAAAGLSVVAAPVMAQSLNSKDRARIARAAPRDRDDVRYCLMQGKKGRDKGTVIGAAGGAGVGLLAGGGVGDTLLGAGAGAIAGRLIGKGQGTDAECDRVLANNR